LYLTKTVYNIYVTMINKGALARRERFVPSPHKERLFPWLRSSRDVTISELPE
jgi:hypothetical protein